MSTSGPFRLIRRIARGLVKLVLLLAVLGFVAFVILFRGALYNRFVVFPETAEAWEALRAQRQEVAANPGGYEDFRGVFHSHSLFSHDSEMPFESILEHAKKAGIEFIFMTDHCVNKNADFGIQWRGLKDGILFAPGYEMSYGFMSWGLPSAVTLDCGLEPEPLARAIVENGGFLSYAHSEEDRLWELPYYGAMEIYNIHTDIKDENFSAILPDIFLNRKAYPEQTMRVLFDRQTAILENWDRLNQTRDITGIAASDAHQNNGLRINYVDGRDGSNPVQFQIARKLKGGSDLRPGQDYLLVKETGPKLVTVIPLNGFTRWLLSLAVGDLESNKDFFRVDMDPYFQSLRFVNTHLLAKELSEEALLAALREGRGFIGFDMIVDSSGFGFWAERSDGVLAVMGEQIELSPGMTLQGVAPAPCRFTLLRDGVPVRSGEGREFSEAIEESGKYRLEAELSVKGAWVPWVYTNPITVKLGVATAA